MLIKLIVTRISVTTSRVNLTAVSLTPVASVDGAMFPFHRLEDLSWLTSINDVVLCLGRQIVVATCLFMSWIQDNYRECSITFYQYTKLRVGIIVGLILSIEKLVKTKEL